MSPSAIDADATVPALDKIVGQLGTDLDFIRGDNGPEPTANALRYWCRSPGSGTSYIDPGSQWQNPWVESHGSRMRDELLSIEQFDTLLEAQVLVGDWRRSTTPIALTRPWGCSLLPSLPNALGSRDDANARVHSETSNGSDRISRLERRFSSMSPTSLKWREP